MNTIASNFLALIKELEYGRPSPRPATYISSVTGTRLSAPELCHAEYWCKNMASPEKFAEALSHIQFHSVEICTNKLDDSHREIAAAHDLPEIGPHSALQTSIRDTLKTEKNGGKAGYISILNRHLSALDMTLKMVGRLHCSGHSVNLHRSNSGDGDSSGGSGRLVALTDLPEYPFDHSQMYWHENRISKGFIFRNSPRIDLLGSPVAD